MILMTRITNFGRKRTYVEAGFESNTLETQVETLNNIEGNGDPPTPPKKKRKRTKPSMRDGNTGVKAAEAAAERERRKAEAEARAQNGQPVLSKSAKKKKRDKDRKEKAVEARSAAVSTSEERRLKRIQEKLDATTCFACRERGHAARNCPNTKNAENKEFSVVGICYRKPINESDPLPFACCFVCNGKGHLASSCPQNKAKGIYPDGGCCKLCGDTSHLARDCGTAGADEDDFHSFKRHNNEMDRNEQRVERLLKKKLETGSDPKPPPKKVINF
ncbi:hypothetical protein H0H81_008408 [Sphagnurus paluster]|uniref:CCHC-type domain-containing protein n=1 Tax=Sphagnurus paluster TaxID=117069 RepID=A0A9P7FQ87_9AGAR|nr:hypothetical protein H0H81_008408 [Sphagnurus paluster]